MSCLYLDRRGARIDVENGALAVRTADGCVQRVPIRLLDRLVVTRSSLITSRAMLALADAGVMLTFMDLRSPERCATLAVESGPGSRARLVQLRASDEPVARLRMARLVVRLRLRSQLRVLRHMLAKRPDQRRVLVAAGRLVRAAVLDVSGATSTATLMGIEGAATKAYFSALGAVLPVTAGFRGRNRRPPRDPANAALSLGYSLALPRALAVVRGFGLEPASGFLHASGPKRAALALDVLEIVRALVEGWVWRSFAERSLTPEHFRHDGDAVLLASNARERFFEFIEPVLVECQRRAERCVGRVARLVGCRDGDARAGSAMDVIV